MAKMELDVAEMVEETFKKHFGVTLDRLRELAEADRDGRCVVLPCKVGDTVYFADPSHPSATIEGIKLSKGETEYCWVQYDNGPEVCELWDEGYFTDDEIGETVFLTREAAEAALKAGDHR